MAADQDRSFDDFDFLDFAQEFLRRNSDYQAQFARLSKGTFPDLGSTVSRKMARSWGLEFRFSTNPYAMRPSSDLARLPRTIGNYLPEQGRKFGLNAVEVGKL